MVRVAGGAVVVVEGACSGAVGEGAGGPLVDGVVEAACGRGGPGRRVSCPRPPSGVMFRRSFARLGGGVAVGVVPELTEHPGAEDDTESWQGEEIGRASCRERVWR